MKDKILRRNTKMRKQIFTLALSTLFGLGVAMAAPQATAPASQSQDQSAAPQNGRHAGRHQVDPNKEVQHLAKKLNLTADQQNQILPILTDRQNQMKSLRNDSSLSRQDRQAKFRTIREESDTKIRAVLNDDQKKTYDQMQQQMRERREQRHEQNPGTGSAS
jgi:Spy/CpxP family protein refolding chaperone